MRQMFSTRSSIMSNVKVSSLDEVVQLIERERCAREAALSDLLIRLRGGELELDRRIAFCEDRLEALECHGPDAAKRHPLAALGKSLECRASENSGRQLPQTPGSNVGASSSFGDKRLAEAEARLAKLELVGSTLELDLREVQRWRNVLDMKLAKLNSVVDTLEHESDVDLGPELAGNGHDVVVQRKQDKPRLSPGTTASSSTGDLASRTATGASKVPCPPTAQNAYNVDSGGGLARKH